MSQRFYRLDSRYRYEKGERLDNFVDEEFLPGIPYGSIVVLTNPTSSRKKLRLLLHLPNGSMPLSKTVPSAAFRSPWSRTSPKPLKVRSSFHRLESLDSILPVLHRMENQSHPLHS